MHQRMIELVCLARMSICFVAVIAVVTTGGCTKTAAPRTPAAAPPFKLPSRGAPTDTMLRIGDGFPEVQAVDVDGNAVTLDKTLLGDSYTLIVFWSTWCGFCMKELPHEVELAKQYERAGLRVIGINADDTTAIAKAAAKDNDVTWLNVFEGPQTTISNELGIKQWPALFLLGPDRKVISATPQLRANAAEVLPNGSVRMVTGLDWTLAELLNKSSQ